MAKGRPKKVEIIKDNQEETTEKTKSKKTEKKKLSILQKIETKSKTLESIMQLQDRKVLDLFKLNEYAILLSWHIYCQVHLVKSANQKSVKDFQKWIQKPNVVFDNLWDGVETEYEKIDNEKETENARLDSQDFFD